jgi:hypothetical protein
MPSAERQVRVRIPDGLVDAVARVVETALERADGLSPDDVTVAGAPLSARADDHDPDSDVAGFAAANSARGSIGPSGRKPGRARPCADHALVCRVHHPSS